VKWAQDRYGNDSGFGETWHPYRNGQHAYFTREYVQMLSRKLGLDEVEAALIDFVAAWHCDPEKSREELAASAVEWVLRRTSSATPELLDAIRGALLHVRCAGDGPEEELDLGRARDEEERQRWGILADAELLRRIYPEKGVESLHLVLERVGSWPVPGPSFVDLAQYAPDRAAFEAGLRDEVARVERGFVLAVSEAMFAEDRARFVVTLRKLLALHEGGGSYVEVMRAALRREEDDEDEYDDEDDEYGDD
jgi:hypothetical protein